MQRTDCACSAPTELGPFDGLLGFSQGANLATIVAAHLYELGSPADAKGVCASAAVSASAAST